MTKGEWLHERKIHIYKPLFDYDEEVDEEFIESWEIILDSIPKIAKETDDGSNNS